MSEKVFTPENCNYLRQTCKAIDTLLKDSVNGTLMFSQLECMGILIKQFTENPIVANSGIISIANDHVALADRVKHICEHYHEKSVGTKITMPHQEVCKCCGLPSKNFNEVEADGHDRTKDILVCGSCLYMLINYWLKHSPQKISPI